MNFFEHQDRARRNTSILVLYFALAVLAIVASVGLAIYLFLYWSTAGSLALRDWLTSPGFYWSAGLTLAVIAVGSLHKLWQLRDGGEALAAMLRAREIPPDATFTDERKLRNVVEEMALASGIPAPRTYLLPQEKAINAFVAGYRPSEAIVVVTQGALDQLDRDALQGVIAHEFSHIFNGDMRLNMRLMAILAGILALGKIGEFMLHSSRYRTSFRSRRSKEEGALVLLGLALMVIGYVGLFFGRLIKAAISRQRELLADASAVQFTRNPGGLAGALITIRNGNGSHLSTVHAEDMSHMCFGDAVPFHLRSLLATHPPIDERLAAIGPQWLTRARVRARQADATAQPQAGHTPAGSSAFVGSSAPAPEAAQPRTPSASPAASLRLSASAGTEQLGYAHTLYDAIPDDLKSFLRQPAGARTLVQILAILSSHSDRNSLVNLLSLGTVERQSLLARLEQVAALGTRMRLPLLDLAMPALKQFSEDQRSDVCRELDALVEADGKVSLFEFTLTRLVHEHLRADAGKPLKVRFRRYDQLSDEIRLVLSLLVHASGARDADAEALFERTRSTLLDNSTSLLPLAQCSLKSLDTALQNLRDLTPLLKGPLVDTLADAILADNKVQVAELELLRAVCSLIDCPVPPLPVGAGQQP